MTEIDDIRQWGGNAKTTYITLGASNHTDKKRQSVDYYATDSVAIDLLRTKFVIPENVWEPAAGDGNLSKRLIELGHNVLSTDMYQHSWNECFDGIDFLKMRWPHFMPKDNACILTNPPYALTEDFVEHAMEIVPDDDTPVIFLLKTLNLEGKGRYKRIFSKGWLQGIYQFVERLQCAKNNDFENMNGSAISYAFFIFKRRPCTVPTIQWLSRDDIAAEYDAKNGEAINMDSRQLKLF